MTGKLTPKALSASREEYVLWPMLTVCLSTQDSGLPLFVIWFA